MTRIISSANPVDVLTQSRRSKRRSEAHHSRLMCLLTLAASYQLRTLSFLRRTILEIKFAFNRPIFPRYLLAARLFLNGGTNLS
jgi:hypothetical protein